MNALQALRDAVSATIASPAQDPTSTVLVAAIALTMVLAVIIVLLMFLTPRKRKVIKVRRYRLRTGEDDGYYHPEAEAEEIQAEATGAGEENAGKPVAAEAIAQTGVASVETAVAPAPKAPTRKRRFARLWRAILTWGAPVLVVAALVCGYWITGTDTYCAKTCHVNQRTVNQAGKLGHASCVACHEQRGIAAVPLNLVNRFSMIVGQLEGVSPGAAVVDSRSCAACHQKELQAVITTAGGVRMSHAEPYAAGFVCTSCHPASGHSRARLHSMSPCLVCHDGMTTSDTCLTCHVTEPLASVASSSATTNTLGSGAVIYPLVAVPTQCGGCHDQARQCDACHGLRMPHSDAFLKGGHAAAASFQGKQLCWKCHQATACLRCHGPFTSHPTGWRTGHQNYPWNSQGCGCHRPQGQTSGCYLCHSPNAPHRLLH